jgi:hypothetical protein
VRDHRSLCVRSTPTRPAPNTPPNRTSAPKALDCCEPSQLSLRAEHAYQPPSEQARDREAPYSRHPTSHTILPLSPSPPPNKPRPHTPPLHHALVPTPQALLTSHFSLPPPPIFTIPNLLFTIHHFQFPSLIPGLTAIPHGDIIQKIHGF